MSWPMMPLGEVATLQRGFDLPNQNRLEGAIPIYAANGPVGFHNEMRVAGPGVVTGRSGSIGKVHYVEGGYWPLNTSLYVKDFHGNDPKYIYWLLRDLRLDRFHHGTGVPTLNRNVVHRELVSVPPVPEQRRIAAILDKADALRAKRREAIAKLEQLIDSGFRELCGSPYGPPVSIDKPSQPDAGQYVPLLSVARLATGHTPSRGIAEYWGGDIPWISLSDIRRLDGKIAINTEQHATAKGIEKSSAVILPKDTVCFSRTASVGFATIMGREMATSQDFVNWVCSERINPLYLLAAFRVSKQYLVAKSTGSTHKTIYFPVAKRFHVYLPPLSEQAKFGELMKLVWRQMDAAEQQVFAADRLFNSLQQAAFSSQL